MVRAEVGAARDPRDVRPCAFPLRGWHPVREAEEHELLTQMLSERARAAAALDSDERAATKMATVERHLRRELVRVLKLLNGPQAVRFHREERVVEGRKGCWNFVRGNKKCFHWTRAVGSLRTYG